MESLLNSTNYSYSLFFYFVFCTKTITIIKIIWLLYIQLWGRHVTTENVEYFIFTFVLCILILSKFYLFTN